MDEYNLELRLNFVLLFQEYSAEIDKLKSELQAARDKDGVFLPKESYEQQLKAREAADNEIRDKTLQIKALEEEMEKLNVSFFKAFFIVYRSLKYGAWLLCYLHRLSHFYKMANINQLSKAS